jgi:hypothetical protein
LFDISLANTGINSLPSNFITANGNFNHTNFKISSNGETIKLYNPSNIQISSLNVNCGPGYDVSAGSFPDATVTIKKFSEPTPGASNNGSIPAVNYAMAPVLSVSSGIYTSAFSVNISDPNTPAASIYYTLNGCDPDTNSILWNGIPISVSQTTILRARSFLNGYIPSTITSASYLFNLNHTTPIISVISDSLNLFGPTGMFDNPTLDLLKASSIDYFDSTANHNLLFSRRAGIIMDGGWGSRGNPQRPFRIKLDDGVLGQGPAIGTFLSDRPNRNQYSDFYLFNGGGNYMVLPFKDAVQVKMMGEGTNSYYAEVVGKNWTRNAGALNCERCPEHAENSTPPSRRKWPLKPSRSNARSQNLLRNLRSIPIKSANGNESFWSEAPKFSKVTKNKRRKWPSWNKIIAWHNSISAA